MAVNDQEGYRFVTLVVAVSPEEAGISVFNVSGGIPVVGRAA
jgi:hypothetical protein